tara:strand:+ start:76 stop:468 length:393 start_codon:yes stop_codon:yes gene_type:complete
MKKNISKKLLREFGLLIGFAFPTIIGWILPSIWGHSFRIWTLLVGIPFLIMALANPNLLIYPYKIWMKVGNILGYINGYIILGFVFIFVLQPIALIMRIVGHDPLRIKNKAQKSYREVKLNHKVNLKKIF